MLSKTLVGTREVLDLAFSISSLKLLGKIYSSSVQKHADVLVIAAITIVIYSTTNN